MYTNEQLLNYAKSLSESEKTQCENSLKVVENILISFGFSITNRKYESNDDELDYGFSVTKDDMTAKIFVQGSYGNGTCVRKESDVDIAMIFLSTFRGNYLKGKTYQDYVFIKSNFDILKFKQSLVNHINNNYKNYIANNHNKCIDFKGNDSSRKDIDIVSSLRYRDFSGDISCDKDNYVKGTLIICNDKKEIINYPEQSHKNSIEKNKNTGYMYKKVVRTLKKIKHDMEDDNYQSFKKVSSYGLECMVYNIPNNFFKKDDNSNNYKYIVFKVVDYLNRYKENIYKFVETNDLLKLFDNPNNDLNIYKKFISELKIYLTKEQ